jgi:hypothetical protein
MRTTINISEGILHELRELARQRQRPFREIIEETLQRGLGVPADSPQPVTLKTFPIGIKPAYQGTSMNVLYDQLETEDSLETRKA